VRSVWLETSPKLLGSRATGILVQTCPVTDPWDSPSSAHVLWLECLQTCLPPSGSDSDAAANSLLDLLRLMHINTSNKHDQLLKQWLLLLSLLQYTFS